MASRGVRRLGVLAGVALIAAACVTINVYFPEAQIRDISKEIEQEVQKRAAEAAEPPADTEQDATSDSDGISGPTTAIRPAGLLDGLFGMPAYAAEDVPEPAVTNPAIRKIIDSRGRRAPLLAPYRKLGVIGEGRDGFLVVRKLDALGDLRKRAEVQKLVREENDDRRALYREIAAATNVDLSQIAKVAETYAATLREMAKPGEWIQLPDGRWVQKR
ncbi:MAG: DUF1318 domain-containing protein [Acidobacteria bacterium]|nr:MAG: DUF1318 domain-containing protein [Acidobacteriota bacterium]